MLKLFKKTQLCRFAEQNRTESNILRRGEGKNDGKKAPSWICPWGMFSLFENRRSSQKYHTINTKSSQIKDIFQTFFTLALFQTLTNSKPRIDLARSPHSSHTLEL